jgi:cell division protein FtsW
MSTPRHAPDYVLLSAVLLLTTVGVITVYSASTVLALHNHLPGDYFAKRQLIAGGLGLVLMAAIAQIPYTKWFKWAPRILVLNGLLLVAVLMPGIGIKNNGSRRWFGTHSLHLQPSELAIVTIAIYLAFFFTKKVALLHSFKRGLRPALLTLILFSGLVLIEPDMGTASTLMGTGIVLIFASGVNVKRFLLVITPLIPLVYLASHLAKYRSSRLSAYFDPFHHLASGGYQLIQGLTGIAAGGLIGRGFDMSVQKTGYLPIPQADFIFSVFTEEWGFIGALALLVAFGVLVWRGLTIAKYARDRFGALMAIGLTSMMLIKTFINLAAVTWIIPITGIPLPFISYGGTSLVVNLIAMGILLSISRETLEVAPEMDELADVVYVEDIRKLQEHPQHPVDEVALFTKRRPAKVTPMQRRPQTTKPKQNWREKQVNQYSSARGSEKSQTAKARTDKRRESTSSRSTNKNTKRRDWQK